MALLKEETEQVIRQFRRAELDTGSSEVQVALLTYRILKLTEHFKQNKKDNHGRLGLVRLVEKRRKLLSYLKDRNYSKYVQLIADLGLRK